MTAQSFYAPIPDRPRDDLLKDYLSFLKQRNGTTDASKPYPNRESWLESADAATVRHKGDVDAGAFNRNYVKFDPKTSPSKPMLALLSFVKVNAGEAYGVEVVSSKRHAGPPTGELFDSVERVISREETYHTRILLGASNQFGLPKPTGAWKPALPLRILIGSLAYSPKALFHPILLGSELGGVFTFNWMLKKVGELFRDEPELKETLEARLVDILVDEIGHVAFNRMAVGPRGLKAAKDIAPHVIDGTNGRTPEFVALGWTKETLKELDAFDYLDLPEEVRRRSFFV